jgi:hypothetical protein
VAASVLLALAAFGCGSPSPATDPVAGGGVRGSFEGTLAVFVLDERGEPLEGVEVATGLGGDREGRGGTDADGRLVLGEAADAVTARADGRVAETIVGADASVMTFVLVPDVPEVPEAPVAELEVPSVSLDGADYVVARGGFTLDRRLDHPTNIVRPAADEAPSCVLSSEDEGCTLRFATRAAPHRLFVALARADDAGTPLDDSDDVLTPGGFLASGAVDPDPGAELTDVALSPLAAEDLVRVRVGGGAAPAGLEAVIGVPGASVGGGVWVWPFASEEAMVPGALEGEAAAHWVIGRASSAEASSRTIERGLSLMTDDARSVEDWMAPVQSLERDGDCLAWSGGDAADRTEIELRDADGAPRWRVHVLDGRRRVCALDGLGDPDVASAVVRTTRVAPSDGEPTPSFEAVETAWTHRAERILAL